jgi:DNA-binding transcriptional MerR regulator
MMNGNSNGLLSIGETARQTNYSVDHLRKLDEAGVIVAERLANGQRVYSERLIGRLLARREQTQKRHAQRA